MSSSAPPPQPPQEPTGSGGETPTDSGYQSPTGPPAAGGYPPPAESSYTPPSASPTPAGSASSRSPMANPLAGAHKFDLAQIGLGVLLLIASLMPFYSYSVSSNGVDYGGASFSAWHGFFGWFGVLLGVAAAGVLAAALFGNVAIPSLRLIVLGLFGASAVCLLLALFIIPGGGYDAPGFSSGHSFGYWLALLCALGGTALAFMRKDETAAA